jgi:demethylmenaquinone methyltransferase/2-methoxy-6-polyprenyl-1,4-benzoquinol methylase
MKDEESLIKQQIEYYRARNPEYDEWFLRKGRYDRGVENKQKWFNEVAEVREALESSIPSGDILEIACGTGLWTEHLAPHASKLVAVDISSEAIESNRQRITDDRVVYVEADLFSWKPSERFDYIFFGFWLSHVPLSRFDDFWDLVESALGKGGKVFFVDSLFTPESTARDHTLKDQTGRTIRKLNDGREFEIIKIFYEPSELERKLGERGWDGYVHTTENFFLYGCLGR